MGLGDDDALSSNATSAQLLVEKVIGEHVATLKRLCDAEDVAEVVRRIRYDLPVDYDVNWREFSVAYLLTNFRKALAALRLLPSVSVNRILDAGCGPGASTLALLTLLAERESRGATLTLLDQSEPTLKFARELAGEVSEALGLGCDILATSDDISAYTSDRPISLLLCSHVLCDYDGPAARAMWRGLLTQLAPQGIACLIERKRDLRVSTLEDARTDDASWGNLSVQSVEALDDSRIRNWETGWLFHRQPEDWQAAVVADYFDAWVTQDVEKVKRIFHPDATYHEKPFDSLLSGIAEIENYWVDRVLTQQSPQASVTSVSYGLLSASIAWKASTDEHERREIRGIMILDFDPITRTITRLREVFKSQDS